MRTASALAVCLLLLALGGRARSDDLAAAIVARAGADVLGWLRIENPKRFLENLDAVSMKCGSRASDDLPLIAQRFLKNPLLAGVEMAQPWTFIALNPQRHTNHLAIVVGVSDAAVFCDSFGKGGVSNVKPDRATAGGAVRHFSETEDAYDHPAYLAALRAGKKVEPIQFKKQVTRQYYVTARNGQGVIAGNAALLVKLASPSARLGHDRVRGDLALAVRVPNIMSLYEKDIRQRKDSILESIQAAARASTATAPAPAPRADRWLGAGFDVALSLAQQTAWLEAAAELDGGCLKFRLAVAPQPATAFSRALAGEQPLDSDERLLAVLPANCAVFSAVRFSRTPAWTNLVTGIMQPIVETVAAGNNAESAAKVRDAFRALAESWGDGFARAVLAPATNKPSRKPMSDASLAGKNAPAPVAGFNIVEVCRVTDAAQARQAHQKAVETGLPLGGTGLLSEPVGKLKYETNVARHAGIAIDRITLDQAGLENAAGANFIQQLAFVGKLGLTAQGPDSTNNIRRLITAAKAPAASGRPPALKTITASFPRKNNGIFFMNMADYVALMRSASPAAEDGPSRRLQAELAEARAAQTGWLTLQPRAAVMELVVPLDKIIEIMFKNAAPAAR